MQAMNNLPLHPEFRAELLSAKTTNPEKNS
jgi:hypothetical protein